MHNSTATPSARVNPATRMTPIVRAPRAIAGSACVPILAPIIAPILALLLLAPVACRSTDASREGAATGAGASASASAPVRLEQLVGTSWTCAQFEQGAIPADAAPTLSFARAEGSGELQATGFAGVNRFFGNATERDGVLALGPFAATRMAGPADRMELERGYLAMLARVDAARLERSSSEGEVLRLLDGDAVVAMFTRARD